MSYRSRPLQIAVLLGGLALAVALVEVVRAQAAHAGVYALARVQAGLAHDPNAWVGRVVLLRAGLLSLPVPVGSSATNPGASIMGYPLLPPTSGGAPPDGGAARGGLLVLVYGGEDAVLGAVRRMPLIGALAPRPQSLNFFAAVTYRVRLRAAPTTSMACLRAPCYEAVLLDPAPWPNLRYTNFLH